MGISFRGRDRRPPIDGHRLESIDLSYNRLNGEIPPTLSRIGPNSFKGNLGICGKPLEPCSNDKNQARPARLPPPHETEWTSEEMLETFIWTIIILIVILLAVIVFMPNILTPLIYHYRREEKLLVPQFMPKGSVSNVLHGDREADHNELNWPTRLKIIRAIRRGLGFLHSEFTTYDFPHGNLKSANVVLSSSYEAVLNDYAFHPLVDTPQAPQVLRAYTAPESSCCISPKCDVYCLGVVNLEVPTGKYPSQNLGNRKGGTDVVEWVRLSISRQHWVDIIDPALTDDLASSKDQMLRLLHIGAACTESDPDCCPSTTEAIRKIE